jgi:PAS domain S-box-containing protein
MTLSLEESGSQVECRVLCLPPTRRDGQITQELLQSADLDCVLCDNVSELSDEIDRGVGALLVSEFAVLAPEFVPIVRKLADQPEWSDVPVVVTARSSVVPDVGTVLNSRTNVTYVERPAPVTSIISAVRAAVRSRQRQYQVRDKVREIAQAGEQFEVMANNIPQLAWMSYPDGHIFWCNRRFFEYTGANEGSVYGWAWTSLLEPNALISSVARWKHSIESGEPFEMEYPVRGRDGSYRTFLSRAEPIRDEDGQIIRWLGTLTDIQEQQQLSLAREALLESEQFARKEAERSARLKDEFLATLSHELRTPLSSILGWAFLIQKAPNDASTIKTGGEIIARSGEALKSLVDDLLDLSRISSGKLRLDMDELDLSDLVKTVVEGMRPAAEAKSISVKLEIPTSNKPFCGDAGRLRQVVSNLLSNAIRFTPELGKIWVELSYEPKHAVIRIMDNGEGIDPEFLNYIFDRFRQADSSTSRKHGGMGIGLSLVKQFVELHGGRVEVESEGRGQGSLFSVFIPYNIGSSSSESGSDSQPLSIDLSGTSILVVDDDPGVRELLGRVLSERGADARMAGSANEALFELQAWRPDLLISDIGMPERDGFDLIREVRARGLNMPAIALTAFVRKSDREKAIEAGFQRHMPKPLEMVKLLTTVAELI